MAASIAAFSLFFAFSLFVSAVRGAITCEQLDPDTCAFAVSTEGYRCVLEKHAQGEEYSCMTSGVEAGIGVAGWVESDECVAACGLDRHTLGISSDLLRNRGVLSRLCSPQCSKNCGNIVDLYFSVAAGEGVFLPYLCQAKGGRRQMAEEKRNTVPMSASTPESSTLNVADAPEGSSRRLTKFDEAGDAASAPVGSTTKLKGLDQPDDDASVPEGMLGKTADFEKDDDTALAPTMSLRKLPDVRLNDVASAPAGPSDFDEEDAASAPDGP